jgi:hypothetical protein
MWTDGGVDKDGCIVRVVSAPPGSWFEGSGGPELEILRRCCGPSHTPDRAPCIQISTRWSVVQGGRGYGGERGGRTE